MSITKSTERLIDIQSSALWNAADSIPEPLKTPLNSMVMSKTEYFKMRLEGTGEETESPSMRLEGTGEETEHPAIRPTFGQNLDQLTTNLGTSLEALKNHLDALFENIFALGEEISQKSKDLGRAMSGFKDFVKVKIGELADYVTTFYKDTMKPALDAVTKPVRDAFNEAMESIKIHMKNSSDSVADIYLGAKRGMGKSLKNAGEKLKNAGLSKVGEKLKNAGGATEDRANDAKEIRSMKSALRVVNKELIGYGVTQAGKVFRNSGASEEPSKDLKNTGRSLRKVPQKHQKGNGSGGYEGF
jgi:hypothetical protein